SRVQPAKGRPNPRRSQHAPHPQASATRMDSLQRGDVLAQAVSRVDAVPVAGGQRLLEYRTDSGLAAAWRGLVRFREASNPTVRSSRASVGRRLCPRKTTISGG